MGAHGIEKGDRYRLEGYEPVLEVFRIGDETIQLVDAMNPRKSCVFIAPDALLRRGKRQGTPATESR